MRPVPPHAPTPLRGPHDTGGPGSVAVALAAALGAALAGTLPTDPDAAADAIVASLDSNPDLQPFAAPRSLGVWWSSGMRDGPDPEEQARVRLWGGAVGAGLATAGARPDVAVVLLRFNEFAWEAARAELESALGRDEGARLRAMFQAMVSDIAAHPERHAFGDKAAFAAAVAAWRRDARLEDAWHPGFEDFPWDCRPLPLLRALRPVDRGAYLTLVEATRLPPAIDLLLGEAAVCASLDEVMALLACAPPVRVPGATDWTGAMTAPVLLAFALDQAGRLAGDPWRDMTDAEREEQSRQAREGLDPVCRTLLDRIDGPVLALHWLVHLIAQDRITRGQGPGAGWTPVPDAIEALVATLTGRAVGADAALVTFAHLLPPDDPAPVPGTAAPERSPVGPSGTDAWLAALLLDRGETRADAVGEELRAVYRRLAATWDPGLRMFEDAAIPSWRHGLAAGLYPAGPDAPGAWHADWQALAEQRLRTRYSGARFDQDDPSLFHIGVGIALLDRLLDAGMAGDAAPQWERCLEAVFPLAIQPLQVAADTWRRLLVLLFEWLPLAHILDGADAPGEAARRLEGLGGDDELYGRCALAVTENGVPIEALNRASAAHGVALAQRLRRFVVWERRSGNRQRPSVWTDRFADLLTAADGVAPGGGEGA